MKLPKIYKNKDADLALINGKKIAIIGFGNQGRAQALNLRDSGVDVFVGIRGNSISGGKVNAEGLICLSINEAVKKCDIISILVPDQVMGKVYKTEIRPYLHDGQTLLFSHGYNIHYNIIQPPKHVDVIWLPQVERDQKFENNIKMAEESLDL